MSIGCLGTSYSCFGPMKLVIHGFKLADGSEHLDSHVGWGRCFCRPKTCTVPHLRYNLVDLFCDGAGGVGEGKTAR